MTIPAPSWTPGVREYHDTLQYWSSNMLKVFRDSPALAYRMFVARDLPRRPPTQAMVLGSLVSLILGADSDSVSPADVGVYDVDAGTRGAKAFKDAEQYRPDRFVVLRSDWEQAMDCAQAVLSPQTRAAEVARSLLRGGHGYAEWAGQWMDETGVPCRIMVDRLREIGGQPVKVELKTTNDPSQRSFRRQVERFGYDLQDAFYRRGLRVLLGEEPKSYFVAIRNEVPYEVAVWQLPDDLVARANETMEDLLAKLRRCLDGDEPWGLPWENLEDGTIPVL